MKKQVFISYSHADKAEADAVCYQLESSNINCWIAPRDISPSKDWAEEIIDGINSADVMVLIFSSSSNESPQVRREIERAVHKGVDILPFRIEDVAPSKSLEYFISTQHWLDACSGSFDEHLDELYQCINSLFIRRTVNTGNTSKPTEKPAVKKNTSKLTEMVEKFEKIESAEEAATAPSFDALELNSVSAQLANYLGPMAKILVKKKAFESTSMNELIKMLGDELSDTKERNEFIQVCMSKLVNS